MPSSRLRNPCMPPWHLIVEDDKQLPRVLELLLKWITEQGGTMEVIRGDMTTFEVRSQKLAHPQIIEQVCDGTGHRNMNCNWNICWVCMGKNRVPGQSYFRWVPVTQTMLNAVIKDLSRCLRTEPASG